MPPVQGPPRAPSALLAQLRRLTGKARSQSGHHSNHAGNAALACSVLDDAAGSEQHRFRDREANALAESIIGLYKAEEIRRRGPWKGVEEVEFATLEWVARYNTRRLLEPLGYVSPDEFERAYYCHQTAPAELVTLT